MIYKKILVGIMALTFSLYGNDHKKQQISYIKITKQMLVDRVLYTKKYGSYVEIKFIKPSFKSFDGDLAFTFLQNKNSVIGDMEGLSYRLKDGQIIYYGNDGSKFRMSMLSSTSNTWIMLEEEDVDGDGKQFSYAKPVKNIYYLKKPKEYPRFEDCKPLNALECSLTSSLYPED